jgi:hypothetical protein
MTDFFFNYLAMPLIFGVLLFYVASWIWGFWKVDTFIHKQFEKPPYVLSPEEKAASFARTLKMMETRGLSPEDKAAGLARLRKMMETERPPAYHH